MIGRTPATIRATRPLRHGVIADFDTTEQMLRHFIRQGRRRRFDAPRVIVCVPSGVTDVERRAVEEAAVSAGARRVYLIEEAMAGAIGAGLPVAEATGQMIVDIGGGTSETAVIALGGMVVSRSLRVGGYELDEAIVRHVNQEHKLLIGQEQAERAKLQIGSVVADRELADTQVAGRDLLTGLLRRIPLRAAEVRSVLEGAAAPIVETVKDTLEATPPELAADIGHRGLVLVGGGALLRGMDKLLSDETGLPVQVAEAPLTCVALGAGESLETIATLEQSRGRARRRR